MSQRLACLGLLFLCAWGYDNGSPLAAQAPRGWNSWSTDDVAGLLDLCFEEEIHQVADAMVSSGMVALNYSVVLLDDCA
jgi:alpha-galactosidase